MMSPEEVYYILEHCTELILPEEQTALVLLRLSEEEKDRSFWKLDLKYGKVDNTAVKQMASLGNEQLRSTIADRILKEHGERILNYCPRCRRLARTPQAQQCRYCGYDWHS